jgi:glycosyltransferase involved in cell wall biosynthesis
LPTYNGSKFLKHAIQSILNQSYSEWELIIVDDASTDNTPNLINNFVVSDNRIRSIRHKTNLRLPNALNTGFANAKGHYLTWISDDNCFRPDALEKLVQYLNTHQEIDIVYAGYSVIDDTGNIVRKEPVRRLEYLIEGNCIGPCFIYRYRVHSTLQGYEKDLFLVEDYDFWLRAAACFKFAFINEDLYLYRRHNTSLTSTYWQRAQLLGMRCLKRHLPDLLWMDKPTRANAYMRIAMVEQSHGNKAEVRESLLQAIRTYPLIASSSIFTGLTIYSIFGLRPFLLLQRLYRKAVPYRERSFGLFDG